MRLLWTPALVALVAGPCHAEGSAPRPRRRARRGDLEGCGPRRLVGLALSMALPAWVGG